MTQDDVINKLKEHCYWSGGSADRRLVIENADLSGVDLRGMYLAGVILPDVNLSGANLMGVDLHDAVLPKANLREANLYCANLSNAYLFHANLMNANLESAVMLSTNLCGARLDNSNLRNSMLSDANIKDACFLGASIDWESKYLIAELLRRAAGSDTAKRLFADVIVTVPTFTLNILVSSTWAVDALRSYVKEDDPEYVKSFFGSAWFCQSDDEYIESFDP